jgi:hypothetical protein
MSLNKLQHLVSSLAQEMENSQQLATPLLATKLAKCQHTYPQDKTIGGVARVIDDMISHQTYFIRKGDFRSLAHQLHSHNTKFGELFEEELGEKPMEPTVISSNGTIFQRDDAEVKAYQVEDQILANALATAFDSHIPLKQYSQPVANKALKSVGHTLEVWNLRPAQLTVNSGNEKFIVIQADYETPKGITSFYVPVEVNKDQTTVDPEVFMGNQGPEDLNHTNLKAYITQQAGVKTKIGGVDILTALSAASSDQREVSAAELALTRLNATRQGKSEFFQDQIVGLTVEAAAELDVETPKSEEFMSFEQQFSTPQGHAAWQFGDNKVAAGRNHIVRELQSFGFHKPQVVVAKSDETTIFYGVALDTGKTAFTVPIKVSGKQISKPTVLLCNGSLSTFDQEGINQLISQNKSDVKVAAVASSFASLKPSEIVNNLRQALSDENYVKAEDALNVLANSGDAKAYQTAFQLYMDGLAGQKTASNTTQCARMIKSAVSEYPVCSHTGLPVNKVYQDKDGNCRPLYRQGMEETYEGASFMNAKILS